MSDRPPPCLHEQRAHVAFGGRRRHTSGWYCIDCGWRIDSRLPEQLPEAELAALRRLRDRQPPPDYELD